MKEKVLSLKEFVIVLLLACVETAIAVVIAMPFAANLQLVYFLAPGLAGLINGIIYVLLVKKCPKIGTQFIIPLVYGLYFLFSGSVYVFMFFRYPGCGQRIDYAGRRIWEESASGDSACPYLDAQFHGQYADPPVIPRQHGADLCEHGNGCCLADAALASLEGFWLAPQNIAIALAAAAVLSIAGYMLGMKMLGKHFKPAGVA